MKKLLSSVLVLVMALSLFCVTAFAAPSTSTVAEVASAKDKNGNDVVVTEAGEVASDVAITTAIAADKGAKEAASELKVLWQKDLTVPEGTTFPIDITFKAAGNTGAIYVFHYEDGAWVKVGEGTGETVTATFNSLSPVALVVASTTSGATSPKTGETVALYGAFSVILVACAAAYVVSRKKA